MTSHADEAHALEMVDSEALELKEVVELEAPKSFGGFPKNRGGHLPKWMIFCFSWKSQ